MLEPAQSVPRTEAGLLHLTQSSHARLPWSASLPDQQGPMLPALQPVALACPVAIKLTLALEQG